MQRPTYVGIDAGNDSVKVYDGEHLVLLQNILCSGLERQPGPDNDRKDPSDALDLEIYSDNLPGGSGHWFLGRLTTLAQYAPFATEMGPEGKYESAQVLVMVVGALARLALHGLGTYDDEITCHAVASLPVRQWAQHHRQFAHRLSGTYAVNFRSTPRANRRTITIHLPKVKVLPEGLSAVYNQVYDDHFEVVDHEAEQGIVGVVDLGGRTADLPVVEAMAYDSDRSGGEDLGANAFLDLIRDEVQRQYSDPDLLSSRAQLVAVLKARRPDGRVVVYQSGEERDITGAVERYADLYAARVAALIRRHWARNAEIQRLRVVGGGALLVRPFLEQHLSPPRSGRLYRVSWPDDPQVQLAQGNFKCARLFYDPVLA